MVAVAEAIGEDQKMQAYVQRLPKRDKRELSRASPQTKWIMTATAEWFGFYHMTLASLGLPRENWILRLWQPRAKYMNSVPKLPAPPELAAAVESALPHIRESRRRVLVVCEMYSERGIEFAAGRLRMSSNATSKYLEEARQSLADILRSAGWDVPQKQD